MCQAGLVSDATVVLLPFRLLILLFLRQPSVKRRLLCEKHLSRVLWLGWRLTLCAGTWGSSLAHVPQFHSGTYENVYN